MTRTRDYNGIRGAETASTEGPEMDIRVRDGVSELETGIRVRDGTSILARYPRQGIRSIRVRELVLDSSLVLALHRAASLGSSPTP